MGIFDCACCFALVASVWGQAVARDRDCANWDVDIFAPPTATWCFVRMYRCGSRQSSGGLSNKNTGDLAWGFGGKWLGYMTCAGYGSYLQVWRVKVRRDLMRTQPPYSQCTGRVCGCGSHGKCGGRKPAVNFGWRWKDRLLKTRRNSKRQFSFPRASRGDQWEDLCLERVVPKDCVMKTTYNEINMASVAAIFKRDVIDNPIAGCRSLTPVRTCMPSGGKEKPMLKAQATSKTRGEAQEASKEQGEQECQSEEEEAHKLEEEEEEPEEELQEGWEEDNEDVDNLKWRWAHNLLPIVGMVPRTPFEDSWNVPADRSMIGKEFEKKMQDPEAVAKQYETRAVEFAHVAYPDQRKTFSNYTEALDWLVQEEYI